MNVREQHQGDEDARSRAPLVLVTGASGFIGSHLVSSLGGSHRVRTAGRRAVVAGNRSHVAVGDLDAETDWRAALDGVETVVHAAGPAHAKYAPDALRRAIIDGSAALARQAAKAGVKRFIYISSIRACTSLTDGAPLSEHTPPQPDDPYGRAKLEAEQAILAERAVQPIALRPPLVIGANAKGNLASLLRLLDTSAPLPFAGIRNRRNIISLDSLAAAVRAVLDLKTSTTGVFHVADQPAISTADMAALLRTGMGRPRRLFAAPGIEALCPRPLVTSLEVDDRRFRTVFGYSGQDAREALIACGRDWASR